MATSSIVSLACHPERKDELVVLSTKVGPFTKGVRLAVDRVGLSANNKFYMGFGAKAPFNFFQAFPVSPDTIAVEDGKIKTDELVHAPAWGVATVVESTHDNIPIGTKYFGLLPLANQVQFDQVTEKDGDVQVVRPDTLAVYNKFTKLGPDSSMLLSDNSLEAGIALATSPGTLTGFGLYYQLEHDNFYRSKDNKTPILLLTSASSKVSMALATYLQQQQKTSDKAQGVQVWGVTSTSNVDFCNQTRLYSKVFVYDQEDNIKQAANDQKLVLVDIAGRGELYEKLEPCIVKAYVVGNSQDNPQEANTGKHFSMSATIKLMWTFMGLPGSGLVSGLLQPKLEQFLVFTITAKLKAEWGPEEATQRREQFEKDFTQMAIAKDWMTTLDCADMAGIRQGYKGIVQGSIPPSQVVVMDIATALKDVCD